MNILSIGFHGGALNCIEKMVGADITSWTVPVSEDGFHYNMTHERAKMLYEKHKDIWLRNDVIITSDTALLSRIFLQNDYPGKLIIYVCNRVDYWDGGGKPDAEYYDLIRKAMSNPNVSLIGYTPYESVYCQRVGVYLEDIVKPVLPPMPYNEERKGYYIPDYHNNYTFNLASLRSETITGRHGGLEDLRKFTAVLHLPYHWNGIANSEWMACGTPAYVPSRELMLKLIKKPGYWFQNVGDLSAWIDLADFWDKRYLNAFCCFNSLSDIPDIHPDYKALYALSYDVFLENKTKLLNILHRWQM